MKDEETLHHVKPFYFGTCPALVFNSIHEECDWVVILQDKDSGRNITRVWAKTAKKAAAKAFKWHFESRMEHKDMNLISDSERHVYNLAAEICNE